MLRCNSPILSLEVRISYINPHFLPEGSATALCARINGSRSVNQGMYYTVSHPFLNRRTYKRKKRAISPLNIPTRVFQNPYSSIRLNLNSPGLCLFHFRQYQPQDAIFHGGAYFILINTVRKTKVAMEPTGFILPNQGCFF